MEIPICQHVELGFLDLAGEACRGKKRLLNVIDREFLQQTPAGRLLLLQASASSNIWNPLFLFVIIDALRHLENTVFLQGH